MLQPSTISFLKDIAHNNNKPWFDEHKDAYLLVKEDYETLVSGVLASFGAEEPLLKDLSAKDCIMRIYRDVRFSKDKIPYKVNLGAGFSKNGRKFDGAGYYLHIEPDGKSFAGGGIWMPAGPQIKALRQEIDYNFKDFLAIVDDKQFKKMFGQIDGERLIKNPKGYDENNPAIDYLKLKSFTVGQKIADADLTKKGLTKIITDTFSGMRPFIEFLNRAVA